MSYKENCIWLTDEKNWLEHIAIDQLKGVSRLPGVVRTVGLPDLHPGKSPVGIAVKTEDRIYPHLIGNDIGCGMSLMETGIRLRKWKTEKMAAYLQELRSLEDIPCENPYEEESPILDLGTIGSGNHFAEFQAVHEIRNKEVWEASGWEAKNVFLLVHCGSRGYGQRILRKFETPDGLVCGSSEMEGYLEEHDRALLWASRNRRLVAEKILDYLGFQPEYQVRIDNCHNYVEQVADGWIHRKGAVSAKNGLIVIPGSRGSLTYICRPKEDTEIALDSLSHGSGRKWARNLCKSRIRQKYTRETIQTTVYKSRVICHDLDLLYQEAPEAYKKVEDIIRVLEAYDLIEVVATLQPLLTYKN